MFRGRAATRTLQRSWLQLVLICITSYFPSIQQPSTSLYRVYNLSIAAEIMSKTIVIFGATGIQGGGAVKYLLQDGTFHVRAVTRTPESEAAKGMALKIIPSALLIPIVQHLLLWELRS